MGYGGPYIPDEQMARETALSAYAQEQVQKVKIAQSMKDPNAGHPTNFWARMARDGASSIVGLYHGAKKVGSDIVGAGKEIYDTGRMVAASETNNPTAFRHADTAAQHNQKAFNTVSHAYEGAVNTIVKPVVKTGADVVDLMDSAMSHIPGYKGANTVEQSLKGTKAGNVVSKYLGKPDNVKQMIGNAVQTGLMVVPGAGELAGKGVSLGGKFLLDKLGTEGVTNLATKAGIKIVSDEPGVIQKAAADLAKTPVGRQAVKELAPKAGNWVVRLGKSMGKGAAGFGTFSAAQAASENKSGKDILKAGISGAETGAILGGAASLLKTGRGALDATKTRYGAGVTKEDVKNLAAKETGRQNTEKMANERGLPAGKTAERPALKGGASKALPEGKPQGQAENLKNGATQAVQKGNPEKVAALQTQHDQAANKLTNEFNQVAGSIQKSDHVVTKAKVDGYKSTRHLQEDHAAALKSMEDQARGGQLLKNKDGYTRTTEHSKFYRDTYAEKGRAPTKAEYMDQALKEMKSGKGLTGDTYARLKQQALKEVNQRYSDKLDALNAAHETAVKEAKTPVEKGFSIKTEKKLTPEQQKIQSRIDKLDKVISDAQKKGTTKSAAEMRLLMRERKSLENKLKGKTESSVASKIVTPKKAETGAVEKQTTKTGGVNEAKTAAEKLGVKYQKPARVGLGEEGSVNPGAVSADIKAAKTKIDAHIAQNKKATSFSGDIAHDANIHDAMNKQRLADSAKLLKSLENVSKADKKAVWAYREAKAAGIDTPKLTDNQKELQNVVSNLVQAANENKQKLIDMKAPGFTNEKLFNPEAGNHRIAVGKGTNFERFAKGRTKSPLSARSLRMSTSSSKARVYHVLTDSTGKREVAVIKNVSVKQGVRNVPKGKYVTLVSEDGTRTRLGKISPSQLKSGEFTAKNGKTYQIGQATTAEIKKATGQKYFEDPLTSAIIDYHETANAVEAARMINKWKTSPSFEDLAIKHGEGVPPKGWKTTKLPQMQGYSFDPKVAHVLDDIYGNARDKVEAASLVNHALRNMMVAVPIRHNLNEMGFYFSDRGLTSLLNPMDYKRGTAALVRATNEVMNQGDLYRQVVSKGFNFMYQDDKAFADAVTKQTKSMLFGDEQTAQRVASDLGTSVVKLRQAWNAIQHKGVWFQQDVLNLSRIIERMDKGMSLDEAAAQTARFNPQYRVPSEVAGSRAASQVLRNNNLLFFGSYHYDQWKVLANMVGDLAGRNGGRAAFEAADKFAALALGVWATHALIDKGLQAFSGNASAYTKPFGVLDIPDQLYQLATGQKNINQVLQSQIFPSAGLSTLAQLFENRDFFTGKQIYDPNMPASMQRSQLAKWFWSQMPFTQQFSNAKKSNSAGGVVLALAGARFPKNNASTNKLYSLKYDSLPNIQSMAKKQAQAGNISGAKQTISQYDKLVLAAAKSALRDSGKPVPDDQTLIRDLKKEQYYYEPKDATIQKWSTEKPKSIINLLK